MAEKALFMIGNGFDLAHSFPTTYLHYFYFLECLRFLTEYDFDFLDKYLEDSKQILHEKYLEHLKLQYFQQDPFPDYMNTIISVLNFGNRDKQNLWHSYFSNAVKRTGSINTWIDLEKEIKTVIHTIADEFRSKPLPLSFVVSEMNCSATDLHDVFPTKILRLQQYLDSHLQNSNEIVEQLEREVSLFLSQELLKYAFCFELYLRFFVSEQYIPPLKENTYLLSLPLKFLFRNYFSERYVLTFNYTDTVELLYTGKQNIHHIHGTIRAKESLLEHMNDLSFQLHTSLVLGFHEASSDNALDDSPFIWFEKFFQRILHKTGTDIYQWLDKMRESDSLHTFIYGHSLDSTDADLIEFVFNKSKNITVYYHEESKLPSLLINLISIFGKNYVNENHNNGKIIFKPTPTS